METKELIGQVIEKGKDFIKLKRDNKTIKINFRGKNEELIKNVEVSESYKVVYSDNEKDGFTYHNGKSVELAYIKQEKIENKETTQETKVLEIKHFVDSSTVNTLIMSIKEIYLGHLNKDKMVSLKAVANDVLDSYNKIIENL